MLDCKSHGCGAQDGDWFVYLPFSLLPSFGNPVERGGVVCNRDGSTRGTHKDERLTVAGETFPERAKVRKAMETTLMTTVMKVITFVNAHKDHIPPITTQGSNPFPYQININQKESGWATRMGIY